MDSPQGSARPRVCVVGSGPGAAVFALELARSGTAQVTVVDLDECSKPYSQMESPVLEAEIVGHPFGQEVTRGFGFGGSSNLWHGVLAKLDPEDWRQFDESAGRDVSTDIAECYENLDAYFSGLAGMFDSAPGKHAAVGILHRELLGGGAFTGKRFLLQKQPLRSRTLLQGALATCPGLRLVDHAVALRLEPAAAKADRAGALLVSCHDRTMWVEADFFVIAAGALETPRLVLQSVRDGFSALANDNVGRYLADHPWGVIGELVSRGGLFRLSLADTHGSRGYGQRMGLRLPEAVAGRLNHCLALKPLFFGGYDQFKEVMKAFISTQISFRAVIRLLARYPLRQILACLALLLSEKSGLGAVVRRGLVFAYLEQPPRAESRVALTGRVDAVGRAIPSIRWVLDEGDLDEARTLQGYLATVTGGSSSFRFEEYPLSVDSFASGSHHAGTMRIGKSAASGVVDADLRVFGTDNVYVCDLSIFPNYGNSNPTLTLCAFGLRLSRHVRRLLVEQSSCAV